MSGQATVQLPARRQGRRGRARAADVAPGATAPAPFPAPERIPRVARVLALAHHWQGLIRSGAVRSQADLARLVGVSRARVTQVMCLLCLAPRMQEETLRRATILTEEQLRGLAQEPLWHAQVHAWGQWQGGAGRGSAVSEQRGLQPSRA